ncbi:MAG: AI-2E family transporter [Gemmatimonadetes bacterium]|nr:AI-2E family transporter [Gemmatimonadota bacterium]
MPILDTKQQRAAIVVMLLGVGIVFALMPYVTGLVGGIVFYVIFAPVNRELRRHLPPSAAAGIVLALVVLLLVMPSVPLAGAIISQAHDLATGVVQSPILARVSEFRIGPYNVGARLAGLGQEVLSWLGTSAFSLIGTATRLVLNLTIALFGLYFLCVRPTETWELVRPYIPFSEHNAERLRKRFQDVTTSTLIGTGLTAVIQGVFVAVGFWVTGLPNAVFWGVLTVVFAILPVLGSGIIWAPGAATLALSHRWGAAIGLTVWGIVVVSNVDTVIRPMVFRRWAQIHPFVTLVGALGGIRYFGILGLLIGPLALSYFFELIRMYREEYLNERGMAVP